MIPAPDFQLPASMFRALL